MKIVETSDIGHILALYLDGEAGHLINGKPIRITEVTDEVVMGYTQVRVLANAGTANGLGLEEVQGDFSEKNVCDCKGKLVGKGSYLLAKATVDERKVRISQESIILVTDPKVSDASRYGMPYMNEQVTPKCLNTSYPQPAWQGSKVVGNIEALL